MLPLSYDSLKTVLQYMEANKRFHLIQHCPSIRKIDRVVLLKIESLCFQTRVEINVNDIKYRLGIYRKYPEGVEVPIYHQNQNDDVGFGADLDQYGVPVTKNQVELPGDLRIDDDESEDEENDEEEDKAVIQEYTETINRWRDETDEYAMGVMEAELQTYINRRDRIPAPYEMLKQVAICSKDLKRIQRFQTRVTLQEVMKALTTFLFGGRRGSIRVKNLTIERHIQILRLPPGLMLRIRELHVNMGADLKPLNDIIDVNSFPLEVLTVEKVISTASDLSHSWEKSARKLQISAEFYENNWPTIISQLPNQHVHLFNSQLSKSKSKAMFESVLDNWMKYGRDIGNCISWELKNETVNEKFLEELTGISQQYNGVRIGGKSFKIPFNFASDIHVELHENDFHMVGSGDRSADGIWNFNLTVEKICSD